MNGADLLDEGTGFPGADFVLPVGVERGEGAQQSGDQEK